MDAPEHGACPRAVDPGVAAGRTIREYLNSAADAIDRTGAALVKHAEEELTKAKESAAECASMAETFRREGELKEKMLLAEATRARDTATHISGALRILNGSPEPALEPKEINIQTLDAELNRLIEGGRLGTLNPQEKSK